MSVLASWALDQHSSIMICLLGDVMTRPSITLLTSKGELVGRFIKLKLILWGFIRGLFRVL